MISGGKLAHGSGFACAVDAHEQDKRGAFLENVGFSLGERCGHLIGEHVEHRIGIGKRLALRLIAQLLDDAVGRCGADVGKDKRFLKIVPEVIVNIRTTIEQNIHLLLKAGS